MQPSTKSDRIQPSNGDVTTPSGGAVTIPDIDTRFALPIICPKTGERVSAETLYNRCCADLGRVVRDHIGDLVFDNLDYSADETVCSTDASNDALHDAIWAWSKSVYEQIEPTAQQAGIALPAFLPAIPHATTNEKLIVGKLVTDILAGDCLITVFDGEEDALSLSKDPAAIFAALSSTDTDVLRVTLNGRYMGWVLLVWGNDCDVISDYTVPVTQMIAGANALAEELDR